MTASTLAPAAFARQPVVDAGGRLTGYELRVPGAAGGALPALAEVLADEASGGLATFVSATLAELLGEVELPGDPSQAVLVLPGDTAPRLEDLGRLDALLERGHRLGLDGDLEAADPQLRRRVSWVRLDARDASARPPEGVEAVAVEVEDLESFERCREAGFTHFQGAFVTRPQATTSIAPASIARLQTAAALQSADGVDELERAISLDPVLSIGLLRVVNSAAFSLRSRVRSVRHAIALLGPRAVRKWATALLLTTAAPEDRLRIIGVTGLARARTCEAIARRLDEPDPEAHFLVGLLSVTDALLGTSLDAVLAELPLADDLVAALVSHAGPKGHALAVAEACERGAWDEAVVPGMDPELLAHLHTAALRWSDAAFAGLA